MDKDVIYWIWLQCCFGTESQRLKKALEIFCTPENMFKASERELRLCGIFSTKELKKLSEKNLDYSEITALKCDKMGYKVINYNHESYPYRLRSIDKPPVVLYVNGQLPENTLPHIGIVGTRNPDNAGKNLSYSFGYDLAADNMTVVSGGALGVDIYAHKGAIEAKGKTVVVLGCGIDKFENNTAKFLRKSVPGHCAVISEYPPGYPPRNFTFPLRNRIISGMSDCIVTVQAGFGSGALITVKYAVEQNRKVFAVPGSMDNSFSGGTNYMIKCGFSVALCKKDVTDWLDSHEEGQTVNPSLTKEQMEHLSVKPEVTEKNNRINATMPVSVCYELVSKLSENDMTEETDISQIRIEESDTEEESMEKEIMEKDGKPVHSGIFGSDLFIMSKEELDELFRPIIPEKEKTDSIVDPAEENGDKKSHRERKKIKKETSEQNTLKTNKKISRIIEKNKSESEIDTEQLTEDTLTVYHTISDTPVYIDTIAEVTELSTGTILSSLTELELYGYIEKLPGKKYVRK